MSDSKTHDPNQMTGAAMIVRALKDHGVKHIFGYPGGAVLPIYDEIFQQSDVEHILVRHEQGAGHAAEGYARSTGLPGVALVTSGPGATNMVTPLTDALMDSIPLVCITGQVPTHLIGNDAFQECDTVGITRPCTKHNWLVRRIEDLPKVLHEAFYVATTGRPGPVVVDVPKDVQFATGTYHPPRKSDVHISYTPRVKGDATQIRKAVALLSKGEAADATRGCRRRRRALKLVARPFIYWAARSRCTRSQWAPESPFPSMTNTLTTHHPHPSMFAANYAGRFPHVRGVRVRSSGASSCRCCRRRSARASPERRW